MKTKRNFYSAITLVVFALLFIASASQKKIVTTRIVPDFAFVPPSTAEIGSTGIKIAMFDPAFTGNFSYSNKSLFKTFRENMGKDLQSIITAKGNILKGTFEAYDFMTYSDKNDCELGLFVDIDMHLNETSGGWKQNAPYNTGFGMTEGNAVYAGTINISGKINMYIVETFSRQKLLIKSLPIPQTDLSVSTEEMYPYATVGYIPVEDVGVYNPLSKGLSSFYKDAMKRAWDMLDKEELLHIKAQCPQIRKDGGFEKK